MQVEHIINHIPTLDMQAKNIYETFRLMRELDDRDDPRRKTIKILGANIMYTTDHLRRLIEETRKLAESLIKDHEHVAGIKRYIVEDGKLKECTLEEMAAHEHKTVEQFLKDEEEEINSAIPFMTTDDDEPHAL